MTFISTNPADDTLVEQYSGVGEAEAKKMVERAMDAFGDWAKVSFEERAACLHKAADILEARAEEFGRLMTIEMGKTLAESTGEVKKCAWVCRYFADKAQKFLSPQDFPTEATKSYVRFDPLGPILAIMPWNFPFWQVFRFGAPAIMAGNTFILKHAPNVTGCAKAIVAIFDEAGLPSGVCQALVAELDVVSQVVAHRDVKAVTLTGSTRAGRAVASLAGQHLKKCVLELGGSDPYVILEDADLDVAAQACVSSRLLNCGQSCIAAKRFIVEKSVLAPFRDKVVALMSAKTFGHPLEGNFDLGPMARKDLRDQLHHQVATSVGQGAKVIMGAEIPNRPGCYYPPTLLENVTPGMPAYDEELFGPAAALIEAKDREDALRIANDTSYGLGAAIFTSDLSLGERIAATGIQAGAVFVNDFVKSDPRLPFGGINDSGYGRELSIFGIREFVNVKTVYVK